MLRLCSAFIFWAGLMRGSHDTHLDVAKLPIDLYVEPFGDIYQLMFEYDSGLYPEDDMLKLGNELDTLIHAVAMADPTADITQI